MENLNAEQVKKALECLQDEENILCDTKCPYYDYLCKTYHCERAVSRDALALINSQEQKIKELAEENENSKQRNKILEAKNERLEIICNSYALQYGTVADKEVFLKKERESTIRKMQERIEKYYSQPKYQPTKEHPIKHTQIEHLFAVIDQIAKEMLEGEAK